ncbi:hypothetical protein [Cellulosimicrobium composti]|uniref:hypothetical protein n=1 Tax=Cellulosimicrobium composti TaxID=2672572 RepID=UPI0037B929DE
MTTPSATPRVRRLPERAVLVELPASADAVEADPTTLPGVAPAAAWRRWGWAVAFVPTVALLVYQRLATGRGWSVPDAVVVVGTIGLLVTALLALVRYLDDRVAAGLARSRDALLAAPVRTTGTLSLAAPDDAPGDGADAHEVHGNLVVSTPSGTTTRPLRVAVPSGVARPRPGDPVAVWHAAEDDDASGVVLVRYHRDWADDLLAALRGGDAGPVQDPEPQEADGPDIREGRPPGAE